MKRHINFKFLAWLLVGTIVFGTGTHFLHAFQMRRNAHVLLEEAKHAEEKGALPKAVLFYSRYLGFERGDTSARAQLGIALDELGKKTKTPKNREKGYFVMDQVLLREPQRRDLRERCVEIAMSPFMRRFDEARQHLVALKKDSPPSADLEYKLGLCAAEKREFDEAATCFAQAIKLAPTELKYYSHLAAIYQQFLGDSKQARNILKDMVTQNPGNFNAQLERARFLVPLAGDKDALKDAGEAVGEARRLAPTDADVLILSADLEQAEGHAETARKFLNTGIKTHPKNSGLYLSLISLEVKQKDIDKALAVAEQACQVLPEDNALLVTYADLLLEKGKVAEAEPLIARLANSDTDKNLVGYLEARKHIQRGEWSLAEPILSRVRPFVARKTLLGRVDFMVGLCYEMLGNPDQALLVYQQSVKSDPLNVAARLKVAGAFAALDRLDEAIREYQQVQPFAGAPAGIDLALARALIRRNIRLAKDARDWGEVKKYLKRAEKNFPDAVEVKLLEAEVLFQEEGESPTLAMLKKARDARPERVEIWLALASLAGREAPDKGIAVLEEAAKHPKMEDRVNLLLGKMNFISRLPSATAQKALAQLESELATSKNKDAKAEERLQSGLALAYFKAGAPKEAARLWKPIALAQPSNLGLRLILCDVALVNKQESEADQWLDDIHKIEGDSGFYWRYGKAFRLYQQAKPTDKEPLSPNSRQLLGQARVLLEGAAKLRPSWHVIPALEGQMDDLEGRPERAIDNFQRAIHLGDRRAAIIRKLVELLVERKRYPEADQAIRNLIDQEQTLLAAGLGKLAAQSLLFSKEVDRALRLAKESVPSESEDYKDHLWLSQIMWNVDKKAEAKTEIALACKYGSAMPETWETYVYYLASLGEKKEAEPVLAQAKKKLPADKLPITLAHCYAQLGNTAEAEKQYLLAQQAGPNDKGLKKDMASFYFKAGQPAKAEPILKEFLDGWDSAPEQKGWARRNMAMILATKRDYREVQRALDLVEENRKNNTLRSSPNETNADQLARALIMARHIPHQREAIRLLEDISRNQPLSAKDRFLLAQLYEAADNRPKVKVNMLTLLSSREGKNPVYLAHYIRFLLRNGELGDAQGWQKQLEALAPASNETLEIKARVLYAQGKEDLAASLLKDFAIAKEENLALSAGLLESFALSSKKDVYVAASEALYRQWVMKYPKANSELAMANFLGRRKRVGEALDYCEKALAKETHDAALTTAVTILRANPSAKDHFPRVESWLTKAQKENPTDSVLAVLADFYDFQERYAEAIRLYRQVIQKNPENLFALNNLAWLLALHEKSPEAFDYMNKALDNAGPVPELLDTRGMIYLSLNKTREALADFEKAADMNKTSASAYILFHLARAQWKAQDNKARTTFQKAKSAGITSETVHPLERQEFQNLAAALDRKAP